jgi:hypothetical protein
MTVAIKANLLATFGLIVVDSIEKNGDVADVDDSKFEIPDPR